MNRRSTVERRKLVYVMGAGHSGSTILGITLGNCDGFFYAGELEEWPMTASRPRWGASDRQKFWDAVKDRVHDVDGLFGGRANRCLERSSAILRADLWSERRLPDLLREPCSRVARGRRRTAGPDRDRIGSEQLVPFERRPDRQGAEVRQLRVGAEQAEDLAGDAGWVGEEVLMAHEHPAVSGMAQECPDRKQLSDPEVRVHRQPPPPDLSDFVRTELARV